VVILVVAADSLQSIQPPVAQVFVGVLEQIELQLGRHHRLKPHRAGACHLRFQDRPGRVRHIGMGRMVLRVAQDQRGARQPGQAAQGLHVGLQRIVAIASLPACRLVALHRVHLHVHGEQVVAAVGLFPAAVDEELRVKAFAHQAALHVDAGRNNGVDLAGFHGLLQVFKGQITGHVVPLS
jgi:hypothetical protein